MFGIEFSEFLVIGVIALIVLGPERLPKVARTAGHLFGRFQRYAADIKDQVKREMESEDLKKLEAQILEARDSVTNVQTSIHKDVSQAESEVKQSLDTAASSLEFAEPAPETTSQPETEIPAAAPSPQLELPLSDKAK